jgi:hypothetical protein
MNRFISRRTMLAGSGCLGATGLLRMVPAWAQAASAAPSGLPPVCLSMYYMAGDDAKFDRMQFRDKAVPHLRSIYGDSLERIELRTAPRVKRNDPGPSAQHGEAQSPILAIASFWVRSLDSYAAATLKAGDRVAEGMRGITNAKVAVQWEQLIAAQGEARESIVQGTSCSSMLYPSKGDGTWDAKYYTETYLPKMMAAYGPDVVRRVEVCKGVQMQGGGKPMFVSAVNIYVKDQRTYMMKGMQAGMALMAEGPKYTTIMPIIGTFDVFAVG